MAAEVQQLRALVNQLRTQVNQQPPQQAAPPPAMLARDIGEAIKPPKPAPFNGDARDVIPFLTRCKGYFALFPNKLSSDKARALFAGQLLEGTAAAWMEPIMRDFLSNEEADQDQDTVNIFSDWENFETAIKDAFGLVNEERQAAAQLFELTQNKSCAAYAARFRQLASKTEFEDESLMEIFYRGLKPEVKDELYKADRPDNLNDYVAMAVKIDERQYERRREKLLERNKPRGAGFNPYFPNQHRQQKDNRGGQRPPRGGTSYGTNPGPMELGAIQQDPRSIECYYCHKKGHKANECRKKTRDIQEGRYKPRNPQRLPEGKKHLNTTNRDSNPQTAIRTTKTLGMARQGYDKTGLQPGEITMPHQDAYLTEQQAEGNYVISNVTKERLHEPVKPPKAHRLHLTDPRKWEPLPEPDQAKETTATLPQRTIAVLRRANNQPTEPAATIPATPTERRQRPPLTPAEQADYEEAAAEGFYYKKWVVGYDKQSLLPSIAHRRDCQQNDPTRCNRNLCPRHQLEASREYDETCERQRQERERNNNRPRRTGRLDRLINDDAYRVRQEHREKKLERELREARTRRQRQQKTDEELWKESYPQLYDENDKRYWNSLRERYIQTAREHVKTADEQEICIRAYHRELAENPRHPETPFNPQDDVRTYPTHKEHASVSWMSCQHHWCEEHRKEKQEQDCFPVALPHQPNNKPYLWYETEGYQVFHWYESIGVAAARYSSELYHAIQEKKRVTYKIEDWQKRISQEEQGEPSNAQYEEDRAAEESYWQWQDSLKNNHDYEACADSECEYDHYSHAMATSKN